MTGRLGVDLEAARRKVRETPVEQPAERDAGSSRARAPEPDGPSYDDVPYDDYGYEEAPVVASPVPEGPFSELSAEDRAQLRAERNLLALLASDPDRFRPYADRIATFGWADARHQAIAWAILATPEGTPAAEAVSVAARACPDAPRILSSSSFSSTSSWDAAQNVEFAHGEPRRDGRGRVEGGPARALPTQGEARRGPRVPAARVGTLPPIFDGGKLRISCVLMRKLMR